MLTILIENLKLRLTDWQRGEPTAEDFLDRLRVWWAR